MDRAEEQGQEAVNTRDSLEMETKTLIKRFYRLGSHRRHRIIYSTGYIKLSEGQGEAVALQSGFLGLDHRSWVRSWTCAVAAQRNNGLIHSVRCFCNKEEELSDQ